MTNEQEQELNAERARSLIERMWKNYQVRVRTSGYELVVLAVPVYPANVEAVSAMDMQDVADLLAAFVEHRKEKPNELHALKPNAPAAPRPAWEGLDEGVTDGQAAGAGPEPLGQGDDGGRAPKERPEPPLEQAEGDPAPDPMGLMHGQPVFEIGMGVRHIRIWANGAVEGVDSLEEDTEAR